MIRPFAAPSVLALSAASLLLAACGGEAATVEPESPASTMSSVSLTDAWVRIPPQGRDVTAGYLTIEAADADALTGAVSPSAERIELHTHINDDGVMRMRAVDRVELPAGETVRFEPGGLHLMVFGLDPQALDAGELTVSLSFAESDDQTLVLPLRER